MEKFNLIKTGATLPNDFVIDGVINRDKYVIEQGFIDEGKWYNEFSSYVTAEVIGAIVLGSNIYNDFRWRVRTEKDEKWDLNKTTIAKLMNAGRF